MASERDYQESLSFFVKLTAKTARAVQKP